MILALFRFVLLAALFSLFAAPLGILAARRMGMLDIPGSAPHKLHQSPKPMAGGITLFPVLILSSLLSGAMQDEEVYPILLAAIVILAFGIWDDLRGLSAPWKLLGQVLATLLLILQGVFVRFTGFSALNIALTLFWVIGVTNAFNLVDSMDGLASGLAGVAAAFFMLVTQDAGQKTLAIFSAILLGGCIGLFYFNAAPARLFLGDSGALLLGFMVAALAIVYTPPGLPQASSWFVPILLLGVPIFDTILVTVSRMRRGLPIYKANRDHTYHRLVYLGMSPNRAVLTMHLAAILVGCLAFVALSLPPLWANLTFGLALLAGLVALLWLEHKGIPT